MELIPMKREHVAQVAALEAICFSDPWSEASVASELANPLSLWIVAVEGGAVLGYVGSQSVMGEADMMNLAVSPENRKRGIGAQLVQTLIARLQEIGVHSLALEVRQSNDAAISLYGRLGFVQIGRRPGYYRHPKEDALILRKEWEV